MNKKFPTLKVEENGIKEIPTQTKELIEKGLENALLKIVAKNKLTIRPKLDYCLIVGYLSNLLFWRYDDTQFKWSEKLYRNWNCA